MKKGKPSPARLPKRPESTYPARVRAADAAAGTRGPALLRWLDVLPGAWLLLVLSAYSLLALQPLAPGRAEVPGMAEAERAALPLLAGLVVAGIIRYLCLRSPTFPSERGGTAGEPHGAPPTPPHTGD